MKAYKYILFAFITVFYSCNNDNAQNISEDNLTYLDIEIPSNFPAVTYELDINPPTEEGFELGRRLFYEGKLSSDDITSCGFCHMQDFAFTHHAHIVSHGVNNVLGTRNAQPLHNLAFMNDFTWDGAASHLDAQPIIPITNPVEMNMTFTEIIQFLEQDDEYPELFEKAFENGEVNSENILKAFSQFMIMMISSNSKYDKYVRGEGNISLTTDEAEGLTLFENKCASCHSGALFTDQTYRNNGLSIDPQYNDLGRARVTGYPTDNYKFRVPNLRNIEFTFPYMHDGRFTTLEEVLDHYSSGMVNEGTLDPQLIQNDGSFGIPLTADEKTKIITFLKTLTDIDFIEDNRFAEF